MCNRYFKLRTEDPKVEKSVINTGYVWGILSAGSTYTQAKDILNCMEIPTMAYRIFSEIEKDLHNEWKDALWESMESAGKEEYSGAVENNQVCEDGIPEITVYLDGGWSKRSYGHNYNAASGVAVIIGKETGKLLYLGVRNKYCSICALAANKQIPVAEHICYRYWSGSSTSMEADILVEGFNKSIEMHNIKYTKFVGDGDSNVFAKLREKVTYGFDIEKIECANHVIKNYGKALHKVKNDTSLNIIGRKLLTNEKIKKLQRFVQSCIYNSTGNVEEMKKHISNAALHIYDHLTHCSEHYCNVVGHTTNSKFNVLTETGIISHINGALDTVLRKAYKLIKNENNNKAEPYMSILSKFNCGKRLNLTQRGSFQMRSYLSGLRYNEGLQWHATAWKRYTNLGIGNNFKKFITEYHHSKELRKQKVLKPKCCKKKLPKPLNIRICSHLTVL